MNWNKITSIIYYFFGIIIMLMFAYQMWGVKMFVKQGSRFTAADGQELCERVKKLEEVSYGFKDKNLLILECNYLEKK